ncbi:MAG: NAD(P)-binding domain-containing protein, partial [Haloquadratum sp.]|nr:NAD(P)-binding domain-containing protein [Haloquadratum sp.]
MRSVDSAPSTTTCCELPVASETTIVMSVIHSPQPRHAKARRNPRSPRCCDRNHHVGRGCSTRMELGVIGLGRMGQIVVERTLAAGHTVVAYDRDATAVDAATDAGAAGVEALSEVCG